MKHRSKEAWRNLFEQQSASDLPVSVFCKEHGIAQSYFYKRKSDLKFKGEMKPQPKFIRVTHTQKNATQSPSIKMQFQQTRLSLPMRISPLWFAEFLKALT